MLRPRITDRDHARRARRRQIRSHGRGVTALEAAVGFAVIFGVIAATVPACVRALRLSRTAEAAENLNVILISTARLRAEQPQLVLASTPMTPATVPRGDTALDPAGSWDHPTWKAIGFSLTEPHWYSYRIEMDHDVRTPVHVMAFGDLDGDGVLSTFERNAVREGTAIVPQAPLIVTNELE